MVSAYGSRGGGAGRPEAAAEEEAAEEEVAAAAAGAGSRADVEGDFLRRTTMELSVRPTARWVPCGESAIEVRGASYLMAPTTRHELIW